MGGERADTKPLSFIGKSEIAQKADTLEARAEAKKEAEQKAEENTQTLKIVWGVQGEYPDGTKWSETLPQRSKHNMRITASEGDAMKNTKPLGWVKVDTGILEHALKAESGHAQAEEAIRAMQDYIERGERKQ